jgi:hypothetical protein
VESRAVGNLHLLRRHPSLFRLMPHVAQHGYRGTMVRMAFIVGLGPGTATTAGDGLIEERDRLIARETSHRERGCLQLDGWLRCERTVIWCVQPPSPPSATMRDISGSKLGGTVRSSSCVRENMR